MSREAQAAGISRGRDLGGPRWGHAEIAQALAFDRRQRGTFNKTFKRYVATRGKPARINAGKSMLLRHASLLSRIEQQYGVPAEVLVAIWGLERNFFNQATLPGRKLPVFRVDPGYSA